MSCGIFTSHGNKTYKHFAIYITSGNCRKLWIVRTRSELSRDIFFKATSSIDYAIKAGDGILLESDHAIITLYPSTRFADTLWCRTDELNYLGIRIRRSPRDSRKSPSAQITIVRNARFLLPIVKAIVNPSSERVMCTFDWMPDRS